MKTIALYCPLLTFTCALCNIWPANPSLPNHRWRYQSESELGGSTHWGLLTTYSGAGNVQDLRSNKSASLDIIEYLYDNLWIRRGTRALFIDFTVYNANINLFCVVRWDPFVSMFSVLYKKMEKIMNCIIFLLFWKSSRLIFLLKLIKAF